MGWGLKSHDDPPEYLIGILRRIDRRFQKNLKIRDRGRIAPQRVESGVWAACSERVCRSAREEVAEQEDGIGNVESPIVVGVGGIFTIERSRPAEEGSTD